MGKIDTAYIYNAGTRDHAKPRIVNYKGTRRRELWPAGTVERFVNLQGSVVQPVLVPPGVPPSREALAHARAKLHAHKTTDGDVVGFIEHGKCPLKTGVADLDPTIADEMERCRNECGPACKEHPKTSQVTRGAPTKKNPKGPIVKIEYFDSCPHVQWVIKDRREKHAIRTKARMHKQKSLREIEEAKLQAAQQQASDTRALLERVVDKLDAAAPVRGRKPAPSESGE